MKHILSDDSKTFITGLQEGDAQPNAVDLRLHEVYHILPDVFTLTNTTKEHRSTNFVTPRVDGFYLLPVGVYQVVMENTIKVGEHEAGFVITRSTLVRNGCYLISGLYDSGYEGPMVACLHVNGGSLKIKKGTRIGQYLSFDADMLHAYNGDYGIKKVSQ